MPSQLRRTTSAPLPTGTIVNQAMRIFISSVQKKFAGEREALGDYLSNDPLPDNDSETSRSEFVRSDDRTSHRTSRRTRTGQVRGGV